MYAPNKIKVEQTKDAAAKEFEYEDIVAIDQLLMSIDVLVLFRAFAGEVRMFRSLACYFWSFFAFTCVYILSGNASMLPINLSLSLTAS